jgi:hypothetical protein
MCVGIPACDGAKVVHQKVSNNINDIGRDKNDVAPPRADAADAFTENLSHGSEIDSRKKVFFDSSVDFDGEATGTSLDVQY